MSCGLFVFYLGLQGEASGNYSLRHALVSLLSLLIKYLFLYFIISDF